MKPHTSIMLSILTATLLASGCSTGFDAEPAPESAPIDCTTIDPDPSAANGPVAAPGDGWIEVVESGHTYVHTDDTTDSGSANVTFGAVLENTTDLTALRFHVTLTAYVGDTEASGDYVSMHVILPGQRLATGGGFRHFPENADDHIDRVDVTVEVDEWWDGGNDTFTLPAVVTTHVDGFQDAPPELSSSAEHVLKFDTYSCTDKATVGEGTVVLRDETGNIIAGDGRFQLHGCGETYAHIQPGTSQHCAMPSFGLNLDILDHIDVETVQPEVYPYIPKTSLTP